MSQNTTMSLKKTKTNKELIPEVISLLRQGHTVTLNLKGYSMRPFLEDGRDKAILKWTDSINIGDVILAEILPEKYVIHRVISINNKIITLRGDGNIHDEQCDISNVYGKVIGFYRKGQTKIDSTEGVKWKLYSCIWQKLFPIRRHLLYIYKHIHNI